MTNNRSASAYTSADASRGRGAILGSLTWSLGNVLGLPAVHHHSVWGRVVEDIPAFCRELVAALAEH